MNVSAHPCYFFRLGRCVNAEPAEVFDDLLVDESLSVFDAADAADEEVTLLLRD